MMSMKIDIVASSERPSFWADLIAQQPNLLFLDHI
jgi:hypothetical protein